MWYRTIAEQVARNSLSLLLAVLAWLTILVLYVVFFFNIDGPSYHG